ncbi:MAG TPA: transcriptional repressor LexA [Anaerolineales bacterium]|nr:transcriptional repressor LexA [Anaerolineales bacterium]
MAKGKLSDRQREIIAFIGKFSREHGYPPTIRQIGEAAKISSTSVVNYNLNKLEKDGYLTRDLKVSRGVRLVDQPAGRGSKPTETLSIPLAGYIFASEPVLVGDTPQTSADEVIELTRDLVRDTGDLYALRIKGDSMIDAMVNDGDIVVMKKVDHARNGEMVAVWLNDRHETTLKHFYLENGRVRLQPANPAMQPIIVDDPSRVEVQGKVVLVLRQMN